MMDKTEFTAAVLSAEPTMYRVAKSMLQNEQDCADAAQQAILHAWERLNTLRRPQYFKTWLIRILINECIVDPEMYSVVDELNTVTPRMQDGSEQVIIDRENGIDQTLYALGDSQGDVGYDTAIYVLARSFELTDVQAIVLNGTEYPLSA